MIYATSIMKRCGIVLHVRSGFAICAAQPIGTAYALSARERSVKSGAPLVIGAARFHVNVMRRIFVMRSRDQYKRWLAKRVRNAKRRKALGKIQSMHSMFEALGKRLASRSARSLKV